MMALAVGLTTCAIWMIVMTFAFAEDEWGMRRTRSSRVIIIRKKRFKKIARESLKTAYELGSKDTSAAHEAQIERLKKRLRQEKVRGEEQRKCVHPERFRHTKIEVETLGSREKMCFSRCDLCKMEWVDHNRDPWEKWGDRAGHW